MILLSQFEDLKNMMNYHQNIMFNNSKIILDLNEIKKIRNEKRKLNFISKK